VTETSFIEYYTQHIKEYERRSGSTIPLAIMTSDDTHALTVDLLTRKENFGLSDLTLMKQELVPAMVDGNAKFSVKDGLIDAKPHGHGDVVSLLF
jgi:UDP-sugar pyrophosphorylase